VRPGDIVVSGRNFGTGSSREQAVTAFVAAGVRMVVAASFSRIWSRNAAHQGFLHLACPELVAALAVDATADDRLVVDFVAERATYRNRSFPCTRPAEFVQRLVVDGGLVNQLRRASPDRGH
jgi:3-isopropylmalate/(R)-2-methylmalate dehydratase small subunit